MKKRRMTAGICTIIILFITFVSSIYILKEANHKCVGDDCPICSCIHQAESSLHTIANNKSVKICIQLPVFHNIQIVVVYTNLIILFTSLVNMKIRMNN